MENRYSISKHHRWVNLNGKKFTYLTVLGFLATEKKWECLCDCGKLKITGANHLLSGNTKSCGCLAKECLIKRNKTHGKRHTKEYNIYRHIKDRCYNEKSKDYANYGGRGIKVCDRWLKSFENFYEDMCQCPKNYSIDRINVNGDYSPENCRWADDKTQNRNRRNNIYINFKGEKRLLIELAEEYGFNYESLRSILSKKKECEKEKYLTMRINKKLCCIN